MPDHVSRWLQVGVGLVFMVVSWMQWRPTAGSTLRSVPPLPQSALSASSDAADPVVYDYEVLESFAHDRMAYTQGLEMAPPEVENKAAGDYGSLGFFYESTGHYGRSTLRKVDVRSGSILAYHRMDERDFGEGLTVHGRSLYQLLWKTGEVIEYDARSVGKGPQARHAGPLRDGWGLASLGKVLLASNATEHLSVIDPATWTVVRTVSVRDRVGPVTWVNEMESLGDGTVLANVYTTPCLARIDVSTGRVLGWAILEGLKERMMEEDGEMAAFRERRASGIVDQERDSKMVPPEVMNGVAYDPKRDRLYVTGKNWHRVFSVRLRPRAVKSSQEFEQLRAKCTSRFMNLG